MKFAKFRHSHQSLHVSCADFFRCIWRKKLLLTIIACIVGFSFYFYFEIRTGTLGKLLLLYKSLVSDQDLTRSLRDLVGSIPQPIWKKLNSPFEEQLSGTGKDFDMKFKPSPYSATYDNKGEFPCCQTFEEQQDLAVNDTDDIMCLPRPIYLAEYKNPCYREQGRLLCLPYFHILGLDKCGTTDFHSRLSMHPHVLANNGLLGKETFYWGWLRYGQFKKERMKPYRFQGYPGLFRNAAQEIMKSRNTSNIQKITADATPVDFWDFRGWQRDPQNRGLSEPVFLTPHAMRHMYQNPKFIVLMRDPVDRLYSDYIFVEDGDSPEKFAADVPVAIDMMRNCLKVNTTRQCFFSDDMFHRLPMRLHVSCYSVFWKEWLSVFHIDHFLILRTEDYHNDTIGTMKKAFQFLGLDELSEDELVRIAKESNKHETVQKQKAGPMYPETRARLEEFFSPYKQDLAAIFDDDRFLWKDSVSHS